MADKNKNNYLWIGIAVVAVIVIAFIFISSNNSQNSVTCNYPYIKVGTSCCLDQNSNNICDNDENSNVQEVQFPKYSDCDKFLSQSEKNSCEREVAIAIGDMAWCPKSYEEGDQAYNNPTNVDNCLDDVFFSNEEKMTFSDCNYYQFSSNQENCKFRLIVYKKEYSLCGTLSDSYDVDRCYSEIASDLKDKSICEKIQDTERKFECIDEITKYS